MTESVAQQAGDIQYVLGLSAERKAAVLSALVRDLVGDRPEAVIPITATDGRPVGNFRPHSPELLAVVAALSPESQAAMLTPLPPDFDRDDNLSDEEMERIRAETRPRSARSAPVDHVVASTATPPQRVHRATCQRTGGGRFGTCRAVTE